MVGMENTSMQLAGLIGTLAAPIVYGWVSGYVLALAGCVSLLGLAIAAPVLRNEWRRLNEADDAGSRDQLAAGQERRTSR